MRLIQYGKALEILLRQLGQFILLATPQKPNGAAVHQKPL